MRTRKWVIIAACLLLILPVIAICLGSKVGQEIQVEAAVNTPTIEYVEPTKVIPTDTPAPTETPKPTNTPVNTATPVPTPTLPTLLGALPGNFAVYHPKLEELNFLQVSAVVTTKVVNGVSETTTTVTINVPGNKCGALLENVKKVYEAYKDVGVPWRVIAAKVLTESGFKQFVPSGNGCKLLQNYAGAPAYCMAQIYMPAHPDVDLNKLSDIDYCISIGKSVFVGFYRNYPNDPVQAVACYKGFCQKGMAGKNDPGFIANYMGAYNAEGFTVEGTFVPFDEGTLHSKFPDW